MVLRQDGGKDIGAISYGGKTIRYKSLEEMFIGNWDEGRNSDLACYYISGRQLCFDS